MTDTTPTPPSDEIDEILLNVAQTYIDLTTGGKHKYELAPELARYETLVEVKQSLTRLIEAEVVKELDEVLKIAVKGSDLETILYLNKRIAELQQRSPEGEQHV